MVSGFQPSPSYTFHPETWVIDRIVLFATKSSAQLYLEKVFPLNCNCIVASADRFYPENPQLSERVFRALSTQPKLRIAVFNSSALKTVQVVSDRLLIMDELITQDFKHHPAERQLHLHLNPERISFLVHQYFNQWDKMARLGNAEFALRNYKEFKNLDWRAELIAPESGS